MVGHARSTTGIVYADVALTRSKVKVKVTGELPTISEAVHAGGDNRQPPCGALWFPIVECRHMP